MEIITLSLGGSLITPDEIDISFLESFKAFITKKIESDYKFIIICGGGKLSSKYIKAAQELSITKKDDLDWIGIMSTRQNAELLRAMFSDLAYKKVVIDPTKKIETDKPIIIAAGWKPGWSTDYDAVLLADQLGSKKIINLTNIEYVYDKDPKIHKDAKKIEKITWSEFRKIVGDEWSPRLSMPFDPIASKKAQEKNLEIAIMNGTDLDNLDKYIEEKPFIGTTILPD